MISFKDFVKSKAPEINEASKQKIATQLISQIKVNLSSIDFVFLNTEYNLNLDNKVLTILHDLGRKIEKHKINLTQDLKALKGDALAKELTKILQTQLSVQNINVIEKGDADTTFMFSFEFLGVYCVISLRNNGGILNVNSKDQSTAKRHINISHDSKLYAFKDDFLKTNKVDLKFKNLIEACVIELLNKFW